MIKIKICEYNHSIYIYINENCSILILHDDICFSNVNSYSKKSKDIPLYEFLFASKYEEDRNVIKNINDDIRENCKTCNSYYHCKKIEDGLINYQKTNEIIKELKELIKNSSEID